MAYSFVSYNGPIDSCPSLFYDPDLNRFIDEDGQILNDMHKLFDPWQILYLKEAGKDSGYCVIESRESGLFEVFFPSPWSENTYWDYQMKYHYEQTEFYRNAVERDE